MKKLTLVLAATMILCSDAFPMYSGFGEYETMGRRRIGISFYFVAMIFPALKEGYPAAGINMDVFVNEYLNLNASIATSFGGGLDGGLKYYPWGDNESLRWQPGIGAQYCWYTIGLFSMDRYTSLVAPASIQYSGKKGFHFAVDAGPGITRVTRVKSWSSNSSNQDGVYGCFSFSFRVGYRFRRPGY
ncbi:MAG: hypothetical protein R6V49_05175 [Bacteroidales bacterium]